MARNCLLVICGPETDFGNIPPSLTRHWSIDYNSLVSFDSMIWKIRLKKHTSDFDQTHGGD